MNKSLVLSSSAIRSNTHSSKHSLLTWVTVADFVDLPVTSFHHLSRIHRMFITFLLEGESGSLRMHRVSVRRFLCLRINRKALRRSLSSVADARFSISIVRNNVARCFLYSGIMKGR